VELLGALWDIPAERLAEELLGLGLIPDIDAVLSEDERRELADFRAFLVARRRRSGGRPGRAATGRGRR
jgi:hypothetical protein